MTPTISCLYMSFNRDPANITFIEFNNFVKVIFNRRSVIMTKEHLIVNRELFNMYLMSLLFTEDSSKINKVIINDVVHYGISTMKYSDDFLSNNSYNVVHLEKSVHRNPLNSKQPTRESSRKKYNKFMKYFYNCNADKSYIIDPTDLLCDYFHAEACEVLHYFDEYIQNEMHGMVCGLEEFMDE